MTIFKIFNIEIVNEIVCILMIKKKEKMDDQDLKMDEYIDTDDG